MRVGVEEYIVRDREDGRKNPGKAGAIFNSTMNFLCMEKNCF